MSKPMTWQEAVRILGINSLYELKSDPECRCKADRLELCWNCKTHAALMLAVKKKFLHISQDIPEIVRTERLPLEAK